MELALEADELAGVGLERKVRYPLLAVAVPHRHSRGSLCEADMHSTLSKSRAGSRRDGLSASLGGGREWRFSLACKEPKPHRHRLVAMAGGHQRRREETHGKVPVDKQRAACIVLKMSS